MDVFDLSKISQPGNAQFIVVYIILDFFMGFPRAFTVR